MRRICLTLFFTTAAVIANPEEAASQVGFSVTQQNGVVTGGGLVVGGVVSGDRRGVTLGLAATVNNWQIQNAQTGANLNNAIAARRNRLPDLDQFVKNLWAFDRDEDDLLNEDELREVAVAVIREVQQIQRQNNPASAAAYQNAQRSKSERAKTKQLTEIFVTRCMDFDVNSDKALNAEETKRMAAALLRSLI